MKRVISYLAGLSLAWRELIVRAFLQLINLPMIGAIYHRLYYRVIKEKASHILSEIDIEIYNVCNLRCIMCPYSDMTREKVQMSMDLFRKIIDDAAANGIKEVGFSNYNEPLLDTLLFERIRYAKSEGLRVHFFSNGTLLTEDRIDALLDSGLDSIECSFDGATKETYERIRVGADFEKTKNGIIQLIEERDRRELAKPSVTIFFVAQKDNYHEAERFKQFWKQLANNVSYAVVDSRKTGELLPDELASKRIKPKYLYPCISVFQKLTVLSNGKVALCCFDYDGKAILGDLNKQTINEVWNSDEYKEIRELHLSGRGDKIKLCRDIHCRALYRDSAYNWWRYG